MTAEINFIPLLVINLILLIITVLLLIANRLLVNYGKCTITVNEDGEEKKFIVEGGDHLLSYLIQHNINLSSSCGGKGSCGYCKVQVASGGGEILPTEEIFMSRKEKEENMRLACQVKVKTEMEVKIVDYLTIVRQIVVNNKFDPKKRWRFTIE